MIVRFIPTIAATLLVSFWRRYAHGRWSNAPTTSPTTGYLTAFLAGVKA